jgi:hypothetical protein
MSNLMAILKAKHQPKQFALEQAEANAKHAERLAFIEGFKTQQTEINKSASLFVSDDSALGFKPNNQ